MKGSSQPSPPPQVSPDGRFWWNGKRWVAMPRAPKPSYRLPRTLNHGMPREPDHHRMPGQLLPTRFIVFGVILTTFFLFILVGAFLPG